MSKEVEIPEEKIEIINQNIQSLEVEIPEEKIEIINRNIQSLKEKMKTNDGKKKYHYHLQQLKQARKRIFLEVQNALFIKYF
ncbi:MAG: hypothetical protein U9P61_02695 [Patescibacteria group bacterium]|nr:hypothetical protein [Patescibacteria group bacterium]